MCRLMCKYLDRSSVETKRGYLWLAAVFLLLLADAGLYCRVVIVNKGRSVTFWKLWGKWQIKCTNRKDTAFFFTPLLSGCKLLQYRMKHNMRSASQHFSVALCIQQLYVHVSTDHSFPHSAAHMGDVRTHQAAVTMINMKHVHTHKYKQIYTYYTRAKRPESLKRRLHNALASVCRRISYSKQFGSCLIYKVVVWRLQQWLEPETRKA